MADVLALRSALRADQAFADAAQAKLDQLSAELDDPDLPPPSRVALEQLAAAQRAVLIIRLRARDASQVAYDAAVQADPMHAIDPQLPLVLLPIRIEAAYLPQASGAGVDLVVRIYPDDIHVDAHEPELTSAELAVATTYWQAVWGAGANQDRLDGAWRAALSRLKPNRAAWSVHVTTPATARPPTETPVDQPQPSPPLPDVTTRAGSFTRAAHSKLLPDHWRVVGLANGVERFFAEGSPIPDSLDVSFGPPGTGANDSDLPFDNNSRWLVDLDAAIAVGMAIRIPLDNPDQPIDQLFVLGVGAQVAPLEAANRLQAALLAHQYTSGLGFLPPGTPTNNTSATRSVWSSAPAPPTPTAVEAARALYQPAGSQNAALTAKALGIDGSPSLSVADFGLKDQQTEVMVIQRHLWNALGAKALSQLYMHWDIPPGGSPSQGGWHLHDDPASTAVLNEHMLGWVRSRGVLPVLRVGNQPYGLLPATALADWFAAPDDPTLALLGWLKTFRPYFLAAVAGAPRIGGGGLDPDSAVTNVLQRLPVCQDIMLRADGDPLSVVVSSQPLPPAPIPGLPADSEIFLSAPDVNASRLLIPVVGDALGDHGLLLKWSKLFDDSMAVIKGTKSGHDWATEYQPIFGQRTFPDAPPADLFTSLLQDAFNDPMSSGSSSTSVVGFLLLGACIFDQKKDDPAFQKLIQMRLPEADVFVAQFAQLLALDPEVYDSVVRELLDVASHRFDAWVVSLAARRLDQMRAVKPAGVVIGAYGWVEDLARRTDLSPVSPPPAGFGAAFASPRQVYVHAPSLHHAATAAVLRAGFESHAHADTLAVNLESRRVRLATWLAEGVGAGQTVGALLGYRFERSLHEAGLDSLIEGLRLDHPLALLAGQDEGGTAAREAIAARNVVDGLDLYRKQADVRAKFPQVAAQLDDLIDALDAFGDLLLAESVHHLVGGNPLRAGLAADTLGRGEPAPDQFDIARTPRGGRPLTWQVGTLQPTSWSASVIGWRADRPRAQMEPHVEAWAATMLGNAQLWQIDCAVTTAGAAEATVRMGLDTLGLCALDVVCESDGPSSILERRIQDAVRVGQPGGALVTVGTTPPADGALGLGALQSFTARLRALLSRAQALGPQHVQGADTLPTLGIDVSELAARLDGLNTALATATTELGAAAQALAAAEGSSAAAGAVKAARAKLLRLADLGVVSAYPVAGADNDSATFSAISAQAATVMATIQSLSAAPAPPAGAGDIAGWLKAVAEYVQGVMGRTVPILASFLLPSNSAYAAAFDPRAAPAGANTVTLMDWLRRLGRVRPTEMDFYDALLANTAITGLEPSLAAAQLPVEVGAQWIGLPYGDRPPPKARLALVVSTPAPVTPSTAFCGMLFDNWTEQLPGLTSVADAAKGYEAAEITGVAFTVEGPEAYPPQAILLAIPPDPAATWSFDTLFDIVQETLDLAKIRTVDLGDLPRLGRVLPALHSGSNLDEVINAAGHNP